MKKLNKIDTAYLRFKEEAELFFVTNFIESPKIEKEYKTCLDILYNFTGQMDVSRGIIAQNTNYGQGKSFFFHVVHHRHKRIKNQNIFLKTTARDLCDIFTSAKHGEDPKEKLKKFIMVKDLYIEDIGDELKEGNERSHYGNKLNVLRYVLLKRYDWWIEKGWKTFGDTNLTIDGFAKHYDGRVADRILQMSHFRKFYFLSEGSFRQVSSTRKLTEEEIKANWEKLRKPKQVEKVDLEKYFNELIQEPENYFDEKDHTFWNFVRVYLEKKGFLNEESYKEIDDQKIQSANSKLRQEIRTKKRSSLKHAPGNIRRSLIDNALNSITQEEVNTVAKNYVAKRKFMELHKSKQVFK